uniref:Uncharacterized protein n=1 Tax=Oreochromis aureus TaxID=47969 RepID=A0A668SN63_OREAU
MVSSTVHPALSCSVYQMFSHFLASFRFRFKLNNFYCQYNNIHSIQRTKMPFHPKPPMVADSPEPSGKHAGWVTLRWKRIPKQKPPVHHQPIHVSNHSSPLSNHSELSSRARPGDTEETLKLLAKDKCKFRKILVHYSSNDTCQFDVTKIILDRCETMSDVILFSGPLPKGTKSDLFSHVFFLLDGCLSGVEKTHMGFIDNWKNLGEKPGLFRREVLHPTFDGAALISRKLFDWHQQRVFQHFLNICNSHNS